VGGLSIVRSLTKTYRFSLHGFHCLEQLSEPLHGHSSFLKVTLRAPVSESLEAEFLAWIKKNILSDFHKQNWGKNLSGEPTGENVLSEIALRFQSWKSEIATHIELEETPKNGFHLELMKFN